MTIGLTHTGNPTKHQFYLNWLQGKDDISIITLSVKDNNLEALEKCDALVLSGGIDVHPKFYGNQTVDYAGAPDQFNEQRDQFEITAFNTAQKNEMPVFAVCRGLQLVNCILGGDLRQNLGDALNKIHKGEPDKHHPVNIQKDSLLYEITGQSAGEINSAHHQAINRLGDGLKANCLSDDGTIEGIEWQDKHDKPFFLGVQWHPERMIKFHLDQTPLSKAIRDRFIEATREMQKSKR